MLINAYKWFKHADYFLIYVPPNSLVVIWLKNDWSATLNAQAITQSLFTV